MNVLNAAEQAKIEEIAASLDEGVLVHPHIHQIMHTYADNINKKRADQPKDDVRTFTDEFGDKQVDHYYHRPVHARMHGPVRQLRKGPNNYAMTVVLHKKYNDEKERLDPNRVEHFGSFHNEHEKELHAAAAQHGYKIQKRDHTTAGSHRHFGGWHALNVHLVKNEVVKEQNEMLEESTLHLEPHTGDMSALPVHLQGKPGPVYKVKKSSRDLHAHGLHPGALVHDSELDALHDDGVQVHMKEESQLDELDNSTLKSYLKKRVAGFDPLSSKVNKHIEGVDTAHNKSVGYIYKEETELAEAKGVSLVQAMRELHDKNAFTSVIGGVKKKSFPWLRHDEIAAHLGHPAEATRRALDHLAASGHVVHDRSQGYNGRIKSLYRLPGTDDQVVKEENSPSMAAAIKQISADVVLEARGRPRKDGTEVEGDDTHLHPITQITKIAMAIKGAEPPFTHEDGTQSRISKEVARHHLTMYKSLGNQDLRQAYGNRLYKSRDSMMQAGRQTAHLAFVPNKVNFKG